MASKPSAPWCRPSSKARSIPCAIWRQVKEADVDFSETQRVKELRERLWAFIDERVRPAEPRYWQEFSAETTPQRISPVIEELKAEARKRGLWNLFLPDERFGPGLSNVEYAPLAEISGWSPLARVILLMGLTNPDADRHARHTIVLVPIDSPGLTIVRQLKVFGFDDPGSHCEITFENVRVPQGNRIGEEGMAFLIAQTRLGP